MATETGPDLTSAREALIALMDDTCVITEEIGPDNDVMDEATGILTSPDQPAAVYSGACKIAPASESQPRVVVIAGQYTTPRPYRLGIPWDSPLPSIGNLVTITSSRRDPELVGQVFRVKEVLRSTFLVSRRMVVESRD